MHLWHPHAKAGTRAARPLRVLAAALGLSLAAVIPSASATSGITGGFLFCRTVRVPVEIPGLTARGQITGDYCVPLFSNGDVLLMVAGGTENAAYWNMPGLGSDSLVKTAASDGYASFAIDRLGTGRSTIPSSSTFVTYAAEVSTVAQVANALHHDPALFGRRWSQVTGVGHSLGSGTLAGVAAHYPTDFNALIITGYGAAVTPQTAQLNALYQVPAETVWSTYAGLDTGYLTVLPDSLAVSGYFYAPDTTHAALSAAAAHEGLVAKTELLTRPQGAAAEAQGALIKVPVLVVVGQYDRHYCEDNPINEPPSIGAACADQRAFNSYEASLFSNACLATSLIAGSGHAIQEEKVAPSADKLYLNWLHLTVTRYGHTRCAVTGVYTNTR